jgi:phosphatidylinositol glycan class K
MIWKKKYNNNNFFLEWLIQSRFIFQHHVDSSIGVYVIDRYTYYALEFLEKVTPDSTKTMGQFVSMVNVVLHVKPPARKK